MPIIRRVAKGEMEDELTIKCPSCKQEKIMVVDTNKFNKWMSGTLIQNAFPDLNVQDRESLMTGICTPCWDKTFKVKEE